MKSLLIWKVILPGEKKTAAFKSNIIKEYMCEWDWPNAKLADINSFRDWEFEKVLALGNRVHMFLIGVYRRLSERLKTEKDMKQMINEQDLTVIGRKLASFYSHKPRKIQFLRRAFAEGLFQESVTIAADFKKPLSQRWSLYRGSIDSQMAIQSGDSEDNLLRKGSSIVDILIWAVYNRIIDKKTSLYMVPNPSPVSINDIQEMVNKFFQYFPKIKLAAIPNDDLLMNAKK